MNKLMRNIGQSIHHNAYRAARGVEHLAEKQAKASLKGSSPLSTLESDAGKNAKFKPSLLKRAAHKVDKRAHNVIRMGAKGLANALEGSADRTPKGKGWGLEDQPLESGNRRDQGGEFLSQPSGAPPQPSSISFNPVRGESL